MVVELKKDYIDLFLFLNSHLSVVRDINRFNMDLIGKSFVIINDPYSENVHSYFSNVDSCILINITTSTFRNLDFIKIMRELGFNVKIDPIVNKFSINEFSHIVKEFYVTKVPMAFIVNKRNNIFNLFEYVFLNYRLSYKIILDLLITTNYMSIVYSLVTMMLKAKNLDDLDVSTKYRKVLSNNSVYLELFMEQLELFFSSNMGMDDFFSFIFNLSSDGRNYRA